MFEDDDYAMRIRSAGLRSVCATDVIVHHFGEASFGKLVPTGEHNRLFTANRQRFEAKWQMPWTQHRSAFDSEYTELVAHVCDTIAAVVPEDATILMVSKGDAQLLDVPGRTVLHFPQDDSGGYAGWYASDTDEVIADLDRQIARGATHIVFPESAAWWFEFYEGLDDRFAHRLEEIDGGGFCRIFAVRQPAIASRRGAQ